MGVSGVLWNNEKQALVVAAMLPVLATLGSITEFLQLLSEADTLSKQHNEHL